MSQNEVWILRIITLKYTKPQIIYKLIILVQISSLQFIKWTVFMLCVVWQMPCLYIA